MCPLCYNNSAVSDDGFEFIKESDYLLRAARKMDLMRDLAKVVSNLVEC